MSGDGLCECGCGLPTSPRSRGKTGERHRFVFGHHAIDRTPEYRAEDRGYTSDCWIWLRGLLRHGYGGTHVRTETGWRTRQAHRAVWERERGPIPAGLELDHLCRVRACVNPAHLALVTHTENVRRGENRKLSWADAAAIRASSEPTRELAARYGVYRTTIQKIRGGRAWVDVGAVAGRGITDG